MRKMILAMGLCLLAASGASAAEKMSGKQLTALLKDGKEIMLGGPGKGCSGTLMVAADGTAKGEVKTDSGDVIAIEGKWAIKKDRFCRTWVGGRDPGKEICETWVKSGDRSVDVFKGKENIGTNSWK